MNIASTRSWPLNPRLYSAVASLGDSTIGTCNARMADAEEITEFQSFTERALKYGRNVMAAAVPIIVFALVPVVDLAKSKPFNFKIEPGGEFWIWVLLLIVLSYYGVRFFCLAILDFRNWKNRFGEHEAKLEKSIDGWISTENDLREGLPKREKQFEASTAPIQKESLRKDIEAIKTRIEDKVKDVSGGKFNLSNYRWRRIYFWTTDAVLPAALFLVALVSAIVKILVLWPPTNIPI